MQTRCQVHLPRHLVKYRYFDRRSLKKAQRSHNKIDKMQNDTNYCKRSIDDCAKKLQDAESVEARIIAGIRTHCRSFEMSSRLRGKRVPRATDWAVVIMSVTVALIRGDSGWLLLFGPRVI